MLFVVSSLGGAVTDARFDSLLDMRTQAEHGDAVGEGVDQILTAEQVASILQVKPCTVGDWARRGVLPSFKLGKFRRFSRLSVMEFLAGKVSAQD